MIARSGFFILDKQAGISSARAISDLRRKLDIPKIGHAGTLDPFATGILAVLVNRATRLASLVSGGEKCYRAVFRFGVATDTDDLTGKILTLHSSIPDLNQVERIVAAFTGQIQQRPPRISAVKIQGKRAYKRARADEDFEISERTVTVSRIELHSMNGPDLELSIWCGSGTYIRSIARDMGEALGSAGTVMSLRREQSAPFSISQARTIEEISADDIVPWDLLFASCPRVQVSAMQAEGLARGDERVVEQLARSQLPSVATAGERILFELAANSGSLGMLEYTGSEWKLQTYMGE